MLSFFGLLGTFYAVYAVLLTVICEPSVVIKVVSLIPFAHCIGQNLPVVMVLLHFIAQTP